MLITVQMDAKPIITIAPLDPKVKPWIPNWAAYVVSFHAEHGLFRMMSPRPDRSTFAGRYAAEKNMEHFASIIGVRLFDDGFFVSFKDKMLFLLKYQGISKSTKVTAPLI